MKLYTEEQIKRAIDIADDNADLLEYNKILSKLTPIELPSDEKIWGKIEDSTYSLEYDTGFMQGVKWVIEQIKQQDNGK